MTRLIKYLPSLVFPVFALSLSSCGKDAGKTDANAEPVSWPELTAFDEFAYRAEGLAKVKDREGLMKQRTALLEAGWAVSPKTMPENAADTRRVHELMGDLASFVNGFAEVEVSDDRLFALAEGLHPVVEALIEAAGMPHIYANCLEGLFRGTVNGVENSSQLSSHSDIVRCLEDV